MITLVVPEPTPSLNQMKGWSWRAYNSIRRNWRLSVWAAAQQAKAGRPMWKRAKVQIERYSRGVLDHDNLSGDVSRWWIRSRTAGLWWTTRPNT